MNADWWTTLPPEFQQLLIGAGGDALGGLVANLATDLLNAAGRRVARRFQADPQHTALENALGEALVRALSAFPIDPELADHYLTLFDNFLRREAVQEELSLLIDPRPDAAIDLELLRQEFQEAGYDPDLLPDLDFDQFVATFATAFYEEAACRPEFQGVIKIGLLRGVVEQLQEITHLTRRTTQAVESVAEDTEEITEQLEAMIRGQTEAQSLLTQIRDVSQQSVDQIYPVLEAITTRLQREGVELFIEDEQVRIVADQEVSSVSRQTLTALGNMMTLLRQTLLERSAPLTRRERAALEDRLRCHIQRWFQNLSFQGMMPTPTPISLPLKDVFVHLWGVSALPKEGDTLSAEERRILLRLEEETNKQIRRELQLRLDALQRGRAGHGRLERTPIAESLRPRQRQIYAASLPGPRLRGGR
jgi:hypothetical protein